MQSVVSSHTISLSTWVYKETMVAGWSIVLSFDKLIQYSKMHDKKVGIRLGVGGVKGSIIQGSKSPTWTPKIKRRAASVWFIGCPFQASRTRWSSSAVSLPLARLLLSPGKGRLGGARGVCWNEHAKPCCMKTELTWMNQRNSWTTIQGTRYNSPINVSL